MNIRPWLLRLYPSAWRDRYGQEFEALLDECLHSPLDVLDILLGALDAYLETPHQMNWRIMDRLNKLRTSILIVFAAYIGFVIGGFSFDGLLDDSPVMPLMRTNVWLFGAWAVLEAGAVIALLAVVIGGLPLALSTIRRVFTAAREDLRWLLVPVFAFLALVLYGAFMLCIALGWLAIPGVVRSVSANNFPIGNRLILGGLMLVFVAGAIASVAAVWKVVSHTEPGPSSYRLLGRTFSVRPVEYAFTPAVITAFAMLAMLIATLAFAAVSYAVVPDWFSSNQGLLLTNTAMSYLITILLMTASTALAFFGLSRGYAARAQAAI